MDKLWHDVVSVDLRALLSRKSLLFGVMFAVIDFALIVQRFEQFFERHVLARIWSVVMAGFLRSGFPEFLRP